MPAGDSWTTMIGYSASTQFQPISDGVTDADAAYMSTYSGTWELTIVGRMKENAFQRKASATNGDTTPSVANTSIVEINQAVSITNFDDGLENQLIEVVATVANVIIVHGASTIKLPGASNITLNADDTLILRYDGTKWVYRGLVQF